MSVRPMAPVWGLATAAALVCALVAPAWSQPKGKTPDKDRAPAATGAAPTKLAGEPIASDPASAKADKDASKKTKGPKTYDFNALDLNGRMRSPQLLYFLERANEELERASLEKRSFIPHMVRSVEEEAL